MPASFDALGAELGPITEQGLKSGSLDAMASGWSIFLGLYKPLRPRVGGRRLRPALDFLEARELLTNLPPGFSETVVASGLASPTAMDFTPDGRLFVNEQSGIVRVIKNGQLLSTAFLDIRNEVDFDNERGLLGIAFDPN